MHRRLTAIPAFILLSGCSLLLPYPVPDEADVDRLEQALAGRNCIAPLNQWERHYFFPRNPESWSKAADTSSVSFSFTQAGIYEYREGRRIETVSDAVRLDHRQYRLAFGQYDITTGRITVEYCGLNCDNTPAGGSCG